ncbi:MAG: hypothetical protein GQ523_02455 [Methanophagales archaeon]|nr:hypothetical protein [Methanophagales archaeon]
MGLCPGIYQSGNTERIERNQAVDKWLMRILYECSGRVGMLDPRFQCYHLSISEVPSEARNFGGAKRNRIHRVIQSCGDSSYSHSS